MTDELRGKVKKILVNHWNHDDIELAEDAILDLIEKDRAEAHEEWASQHRRIVMLYKQAKELQAKADELFKILFIIVDKDPCSYDHSGNCTAHFYENPCNTKLAQEILLKFKA